MDSTFTVFFLIILSKTTFFFENRLSLSFLWGQDNVCFISGQLRFWNPDDLNASQSGSSPPQNWIEEKLQEVCEDLGITRDGHLNRKKLVSICEQYGLQSIDGEVGLPSNFYSRIIIMMKAALATG